MLSNVGTAMLTAQSPVWSAFTCNACKTVQTVSRMRLGDQEASMCPYIPELCPLHETVPQTVDHPSPLCCTSVLLHTASSRDICFYAHTRGYLN